MSYLTIYEFKGKKIKDEEEVNNSWHGAIAVWSFLCKKYLGYEMSLIDNACMRSIWNLNQKSGLSRNELIVLKSTLDYAMVKSENFKELAEAMREFDAECSEAGYATNLKEQADIIESLIGTDITAVSWVQTSCGEDVWARYHFTQKKHWYVFDDLN
jgi:hypothetical protein